MRRGLTTWLLGVLFASSVASVTATAPCWAQVPLTQASAEGLPNQAAARQHFERSLELYRAGKYALALEQLSRAAELDPGGKDLFFNLALVHEKLGQLPQAIAALERYSELESEPSERERARLTIERLRGAQASLPAPTPAPAPTPGSPPAPADCPTPPPERPAQAPAARVALVGAASVAGVALAVGALFGLKALRNDAADARTGPSLSPQELRERGRRAQHDALVADVAFAVSAAAAGTFFGLWCLAPTEPHRRAAGVTLRSYF